MISGFKNYFRSGKQTRIMFSIGLIVLSLLKSCFKKIIIIIDVGQHPHQLAWQQGEKVKVAPGGNLLPCWREASAASSRTVRVQPLLVLEVGCLHAPSGARDSCRVENLKGISQMSCHHFQDPRSPYQSPALHLRDLHSLSIQMHLEL